MSLHEADCTNSNAAIFYPGNDSNEKQNLELFSNSIMSAAPGYAVNTVFGNFTDALEAIYQMALKERLILCGSSLSFMEHQVLGYQSPLYGRRAAQMKILPFTFAEFGRYYRNFDKQELALAYGIAGGIPLYMSKMDDKKPMEDNIKDNFFDTSAYLFEEPGNLMKQECREPM